MGRLETPGAATQTFPRKRRQAAHFDRVSVGAFRPRCPRWAAQGQPAAGTASFTASDGYESRLCLRPSSERREITGLVSERIARWLKRSRLVACLHYKQ